MHLVIAHPEPAAAREWQQELAMLLPDARLTLDDGRSPVSADYAVGWMPAAGFFNRVTGLRAFFSMGAGVERLLRDPALPQALPVFRLQDAGMGWQMAEYCLAQVLALRTRAADYARQQSQRQWLELPALRREQFRIGLLGHGVLGRQVADAFLALGYPVAAAVRSQPAQPPAAGVELFVGAQRLAAFLARTDVLILLAPLTTDTENLVDARALSLLPKGAWLINIARGALVDDQALLAALDSGQLAGATLDVFRTEPLPPEHRFWTHPRVQVTPHVSGPTLVPESARQLADKIRSFHSGQAPDGCVDRQRGY